MIEIAEQIRKDQWAHIDSDKLLHTLGKSEWQVIIIINLVLFLLLVPVETLLCQHEDT